MRLQTCVGLLLPILLWTVPSAKVRVVDIAVISTTNMPNSAYERITGRVNFSIRVDDLHNQRIVDLDKAVNLSHGEVRFSSDFIAVRSKDAKRRNGTLLLEIPNRGHPAILAIVDGEDDWLLRNGYTVVSLGWQWDAPGEDSLRLQTPIAKDNGKQITGLARGDLMPSHPMDEIPLGHLITGRIGGTEYSVAAPNDARNTLTVRDSPTAQRTAIPPTQWNFDGDRHIRLNRGFRPGKIYE